MKELVVFIFFILTFPIWGITIIIYSGIKIGIIISNELFGDIIIGWNKNKIIRDQP